MAEKNLVLSETASNKIKSDLGSERLDTTALRVTVGEDGAAFDYQLEFVDRSEKGPEDLLVETSGVRVFIDSESAPRVAGATLEYVDDLSGSGFRFDNPNSPALIENPLAARVQRVIEEYVNPDVAGHGGHVRLMDVQETRVFLRLGGGCQGCGMADVTLKQGIESTLREHVPEITEVLDVTDHESGADPFYA